VLPGLSFENVRAESLEWIWQKSESFCKFRGEEWMPEPCRSCDRRQEDFGGCRCQAFLLTADEKATDPACSLAPAHHLVQAAALQAKSEPTIAKPTHASSLPELQRQKESLWSYRRNPE